MKLHSSLVKSKVHLFINPENESFLYNDHVLQIWRGSQVTHFVPCRVNINLVKQHNKHDKLQDVSQSVTPTDIEQVEVSQKDSTFELSKEEINLMLQFLETDSARYFANGAGVSEIGLTHSDGYKLLHIRLPSLKLKEGVTDVIIPTQFFKALITHSKTESFYIYFNDDIAYCELGNGIKVKSKLIAGQYPPVLPVINSIAKTHEDIQSVKNINTIIDLHGKRTFFSCSKVFTQIAVNSTVNPIDLKLLLNNCTTRVFELDKDGCVKLLKGVHPNLQACIYVVITPEPN